MDQHPVQGGVAILLGMLHAKKTGISSGCLALWIVCVITCFLPGQLKMSSTSNKFHNDIIVLCTRFCTFFLSQRAGTRETRSINRVDCTTNLPSLCLMQECPPMAYHVPPVLCACFGIFCQGFSIYILHMELTCKYINTNRQLKLEAFAIFCLFQFLLETLNYLTSNNQRLRSAGDNDRRSKLCSNAVLCVSFT